MSTDVAPAPPGRSQRPRSGNFQQPWRSIPGGPPEPDFNKQRAAVQAINSERTKLYDRLESVKRRLDGLAPPNAAASPSPEENERRVLKQQLAAIVAQQRQERAARAEKKRDVTAARTQIGALRRQLQQVQQDVGVFESVEEIDRATALLMRRLETGSGSLKTEKKTVQRLQQLESARSLLARIAPLEDALEDAESQRNVASKEYATVLARLDALNQNYEERLQQQQRLAAAAEADQKAAGNPRAERQALIAERQTISTELSALAERLRTLHRSFDAELAQWQAWKARAQELYQEQAEQRRREQA